MLLETEDLEQPTVAVTPDEPLPQPPPTPERYRAETLQDFVDDVLGKPEPDQDADVRDVVDDPLKEPEPEQDAKEPEPDPDEGFQGFVDDLLESLDE